MVQPRLAVAARTSRPLQGRRHAVGVVCVLNSSTEAFEVDVIEVRIFSNDSFSCGAGNVDGLNNEATESWLGNTTA